MKNGFTYGKKEKLKSRKLITQLFAEGRSINSFPIRIIYSTPPVETDFRIKVGVSVSSRNFKKAVDRNRIKRLLREAYRHNKNILLEHVEQKQQQMILFIIYTDKSLPDLETLNKKMQVALNKLIASSSERTPANT